MNSVRRKNESLIRECDRLRSENENLKDEHEKVSDEINQVKKECENNKYETQSVLGANEKLLDYVKVLEKQCLPKVRKDIDEIKRPSGRLKTVSQEAEKALWFAEAFGLTPKVLTCTSKEGKKFSVKLSEQENYNSVDSEDKQRLRELIYILDKFSISDAAYHELSMLNEDLPRKRLVIQERGNINNIFHVERTPGDKYGAYVSIKDEIIRYIEHNDISNESPVIVKLAGDGSKVSRISNYVTLTLSFPGRDNCVSTKNIKTIGIIKCKESYEELSVCCKHIFEEFNEILTQPEITVADKKYSVDMLFNGDMKFIHTCLGLSGATANYACPWCLVHKDDRADISRDMEFYEREEMRRTTSKMNSDAENKKFGSKHRPLINLEPNKIVPDELHLFLRINDILLQNLLDDCRQQDAKAAVLRQKPECVQRLVKQINECGVNFNIWTDKQSGTEQYTSLTGCDFRKLGSELPNKLCFIINHDTHDDTVFLWRELREIQKCVTQKNAMSNPKTVFSRVQKWIKVYLSLGTRGRLGFSRVTPYMHALLYHVPSFMRVYGSLAEFSGQGVEKINDEVKFIHQKRCNKQDPTVDELKVRKRLELLIETNCDRETRSYQKVNEQFWEETIKTNHAMKKRRIELEMKTVNEKYEKEMKESEKPIESMSVNELKEKYKVLTGKTTRLKKLEKLIDLVRIEVERSESCV